MPARKKTSSKRPAKPGDINVTAAVSSGKNAVEEVIAYRTSQQRKRSAKEKKIPARPLGVGLGLGAAAPSPALPAITLDFFGKRKSIGVLLAEGDSWFDYPMRDILGLLDDEYLYDVESVAHKGDCVEDMAYSNGQFDEFTRRLIKLLGEGKVPRAILISGGGNDIAGDEFAILLNHATSTLPPLNENIVSGVVDVRLKEAYVRMLSGLTTIAKGYLGKPIPIIVHGYDYPIPDGRGFAGGWWVLPGPWLKPGFLKKGHEDFATNFKVVKDLIDRFNVMLSAVCKLPQFSHVHYLDLRNTLKPDKKHWANELHPSPTGFDMVTKKFADLIAKV